MAHLHSLKKHIVLEVEGVLMAKETLPFKTGNPKNAAAIELRAWVRFRSEQDIACQPEAAEYCWAGSIQDVSPGGLALNLRRPFVPGTILSVELTPKAAGPRCLVVRVGHATKQTNDRWIIGCEFTSPLSEEELQSLLEE